VCLVFRFETPLGIPERLRDLGKKIFWKAVIWMTMKLVLLRLVKEEDTNNIVSLSGSNVYTVVGN
jgi:hypothetical protein